MVSIIPFKDFQTVILGLRMGPQQVLLLRVKVDLGVMTIKD